MTSTRQLAIGLGAAYILLGLGTATLVAVRRDVTD